MDCVTVYHRIVSTMFEDGIVNAGRLYVLYVFTQIYYAQYPDRACDIWTAYNWVLEGLRCVTSSARKSDQSEVAISGRLANQKPGKRTNQKAEYKKKQPIDSIDTKFSYYKKQRQESRDSHFIPHVT